MLVLLGPGFKKNIHTPTDFKVVRVSKPSQLRTHNIIHVVAIEKGDSKDLIYDAYQRVSLLGPIGSNVIMEGVNNDDLKA